MSKSNEKPAPSVSVMPARPLLDEESFSREVSRLAAVYDFESDSHAFARALWPLVARLAEAAWDESAEDCAGGINPYRGGAKAAVWANDSVMTPPK